MNEEFTRAPHRRPSADTPLHTAALLIDFDNVTMGIRSNLGQELRNFLDSDIIRGKVAVQRAYADWRRYPQYIVPLSESSIDLIFAPAYGSSKKNATDIRLAIDALELVFTRPEIGTFILLSGDSDFSSLVLKLKEYGKYVIGVGLQESTSDILVQNCDEYFSYNRLSGLTSSDDLVTEKHDPWELTSKAIARMAERGDVMRSDRLKQVMLEMDPSFDEKTAGFSKFNRFLGEAAQRELIYLRKRENGQYEVAPPKGGASSEPAPAKTDVPRRTESGGGGRSRRGRRGGRSSGRGQGSSDTGSTAPASTPVPSSGDALQDAYDALASVVSDLFKSGSPVRDSMSKRKLLERDASFDESTLGFAKFSLFLRQAAEAGVIQMDQRDDGNYYLSPSEGGAKPAAQKPDAPRTRQKQDTSSSTDSTPAEPTSFSDAVKRTFGRFRRGSAPEPTKTPRSSSPSGQPAAESPVAETTSPPARQEPRSRPSERAGGQKEASRGDEGGQQRGGRQRGGQQGGGQQGGGQRGGRKPSGESGRGGQKRDDRPRGGSSRDRGPRGDAQESTTASAPEAEAPEAKTRDRSDRGSRSGGRQGGGRGGRARGSQKPETSAGAPKRDERSDTASRRSDSRPETSKKAESKPADAKAPESKPAEPTAAPAARTLGRYRSGSRGRTPARPASESTASRIGPISDDEMPQPTKRPAEDRAEPEKSASPPASTGGNGGEPDAPAGGPIDHMVRNYAGVGKRTAEVLFERFGEGVFDVIDNDPTRLTEVLSEGRAKVVVEARRTEREA